MVSAKKPVPDGTAPSTGHKGAAEFFTKRRRAYLGLLAFVVVAGLPIAAIPKLRGRLLSRAFVLNDAIAGKIKPVVAQVGANMEPLPPEFERPVPPEVPIPKSLPPAKMYVMSRDGKITPQTPSQRGKLEVAPPAVGMGEESGEQAANEPETGTDSEPKYQQGKAEQTAYDLLLKSSAAVASIAQGSNASLHFKSWDAANRGDDTYWVRLKIQGEGNRLEDYIWQVKIQEKQVIPLNFYARSLP